MGQSNNTSRRIGRWLTLAAFSALAATASSAAEAAEISVPMDQVRIVNFGRPVSTVFVGNPIIADVTVVDSTRVFLMGKNFGTTNLLALDENGQQIANDRIVVYGRTGSIVTVFRGRAQTTLTCVDGDCQPAPMPGDESEGFEAVNAQITAREDGILAAADGDGP